MPTGNVSLTEEFDRFVARSVKRGRYANASDVVRSALRVLEQEEREFEEKMKALRNAIAEGDTGNSMEGEDFSRDLDNSINRPAREKGEKVA